jgi:hypothetical protein
LKCDGLNETISILHLSRVIIGMNTKLNSPKQPLAGIITADETMKILNVSRATLCRIEKDGHLQGIPKRSYYLEQVQALMLKTGGNVFLRPGRRKLCEKPNVKTNENK